MSGRFTICRPAGFRMDLGGSMGYYEMRRHHRRNVTSNARKWQYAGLAVLAVVAVGMSVVLLLT